MFLLAGLGNPGLQYEKNRHNVGFMAVDAIARRYAFPSFSSRHHGEIGRGIIGGHDVLLLKPQTYMNRSGVAVGEAMRFYKIPPASVWVVHDDLDLAPCKLRLKRGGGDGGHNGLKSIDQHIGKDYGRIRFGIGHPGERALVTAYVLGDFTAQEKPQTDHVLTALASEIPLLLEGKGELMLTNLARAGQEG